MNKDQLQKQLLKIVKKGIKPSDLKKKGSNILHNSTPASTPPASPTITPIDSRNNRNNKKQSEQSEQKKIKDLEKEVNFWSQTASQHLSSLQKATAENDYLKEQVQELKNNPTQLNKEVETALKEANSKIREQEKELNNLNNKINSYQGNINKLQTNNQALIQNITNLQNQAKNTTNIKVNNNNKETIPTKTFFCDGCQLTKQGEYIKRKVDAPFEPRLHGRTCYLCSSCSPYVKELNETNTNNNHQQLYD